MLSRKEQEKTYFESSDMNNAVTAILLLEFEFGRCAPDNDHLRCRSLQRFTGILLM